MAFTLDSMSSNNCNWRNHWNFHSSDRTDALLQPHNVCYRFDFCVVCRRRRDECQQKPEQFSSSQIEWDDSWLSEKDSTVSKSSFFTPDRIYNKTIKILLIFQLFCVSGLGLPTLSTAWTTWPIIHCGGSVEVHKRPVKSHSTDKLSTANSLYVAINYGFKNGKWWNISFIHKLWCEILSSALWRLYDVANYPLLTTTSSSVLRNCIWNSQFYNFRFPMLKLLLRDCKL